MWRGEDVVRLHGYHAIASLSVRYMAVYGRMKHHPTPRPERARHSIRRCRTLIVL